MTDTEEFRRIYIRHADKEYANGDANLYKHDPGITSEGIAKTKMVASHLVNLWGPPDRIIISPYRRTRETAIIMHSVLKNKVPTHIDTTVSEYLGNHRTVPIDVTESTLIHDPPHPESFVQMKSRVKTHHDNITSYAKKKKKGVIWIITHGIIIKRVASLIGVKMPKEFPNLSCFSIIDGDKITKTELLIFKENKTPLDEESDSCESISVC
jgi:broad specificity phosphatase PhoE